MRKLLLTQSQVSIAITTTVGKFSDMHTIIRAHHGIVTVFTFLLFLAGYILQQNTVRNIHETIRPRLPRAPDTANIQTLLSEEIQPSRLFGGSEGSQGRIAFQQFLRTDDAASRVDWKRLAHVQLARNHHDVCNAVMIFSNLASMKSPARRILLFPQAWALEKAENAGDSGDPWLETSIRLLRLAARRYGVELRPVTPTIEATAERSALYSLAALADLKDLDRVMSMESPGVILDASRFDAILAFTESAPVALLQDTSEQDSVHSDDIYLIEPNERQYQDLVAQIQSTPGYNDTMFTSLLKDPLLLAASIEQNVLVRSVGELHNVDEDFNSTQFMLSAAYMRFSDPVLPGPEWDVPYEQRREARPQNQDADWLWTELYGQFAQSRSEICGLNLEPWRP